MHDKTKRKCKVENLRKQTFSRKAILHKFVAWNAFDPTEIIYEVTTEEVALIDILHVCG